MRRAQRSIFSTCIATLPLIALPSLAVVFARELEPWQFMWTMAFAIYAGCKWMTWWTCDARVPLPRHIAYLLAWPGLDATAFLASDRIQRVAKSEWIAAFTKLAIGLALLFSAIQTVAARPYAAGWLGMIAIVLVLHFGLFHVLSCVYRTRGIDAPPLMNRPAIARSVADFWGRRWNVAFRDITHRFLFKPLTKRLGARPALLIGFIVSGIVHELVITVPAHGGYGLPTLYFAAQGAAMLLERTHLGARIRGHVFTLLITAGLAPVLFPPALVERVIAPFLLALRAAIRGSF